MKFFHQITFCGAALLWSAAQGYTAPTTKAPTTKASKTATGSAPVPATGLLLAHNGKVLMPIVISAKASHATQKIAQELASYLGRMIGSTVEIKPGDGKSGVVLGTLKEFPTPSLDKALETRNSFDGREAFAIRSEKNRVLLLSATDLGVSHAAFRFLETLGYRHFFQAKTWEVIPSTPTIRYTVNQTDRPAVLARSMFYGFGVWEQKAQDDFEDWKRHNLMAQSRGLHTGHAWYGVVIDNKAEFDAHPEYYALVKQPDGTLVRQGPMLEMGNPNLRKLIAKWALDFFRKSPGYEMLSVEAADGFYANESPESKAYGENPSEQIFKMANEVARVVRAEFPDKWVGVQAYSNHSDPPSFDLEPNLYVELTHGLNDSQKGYRFDDLLRLWRAKTPNLGIYTYLSVWNSDFDRLPGYDSRVPAQMRRYAALKVSSVVMESSNNWGPRGLNYYLANRLLWNPETDPKALLRDFYEKAFGAAAPAMKRYYERLDAATVRLSNATLRDAMDDLHQASQLAKGDAAVQARLDDLKGYHVFLDLRAQFDAVPKTDIPTRKAAAMAMLNFGYRTRSAYMEHWRALSLDYVSQELAPELGEPTWIFQTGSFTPRPFEFGEAPTHDEMDKLFQETRSRYPLQPVEQKKFSNDLVPVRFDDPRPFNNKHWSDEFRLALYSRGEALQFEIETPRLESLFKANWSVTDRAGKRIGGGQLPSDGQKHPMMLRVPQAGVYFLHYEAQRTSGTFEASTDQRAVWDLNLESGGGGSLPPRYFYVPKGTKEIQFYYADPEGRAITFAVRSPDDSVNQLIRHNNRTAGIIYKVSVPADQDGKVWWLDSLAMGRLHFFNVPNYIAASPRALLVPREVAQQDRLQIAEGR